MARWLQMGIVDKVSKGEISLPVGGVMSKGTEEMVPVAFVENVHLKPGWREIREVREIRIEHKASNKMEQILFLSKSLGFIPPPIWKDLVRDGMISNNVFGATAHRGAFLLPG